MASDQSAPERPVLVIGLGNTLMGDDGVGCRVAEALGADPRLPAQVEVIAGGTDLFRFTDSMKGRRQVIVIDALADGAPAGTVCVVGEDVLDCRQEHAHHLSVAQTIQLLRIVMPVRFTLLGVSISSAQMKSDLSPQLSGRMPAIIDRVLEELRWSSST